MEPALELPVRKQDADFGVIEGMERMVMVFFVKFMAVNQGGTAERRLVPRMSRDSEARFLFYKQVLIL